MRGNLKEVVKKLQIKSKENYMEIIEEKTVFKKL